MKKIKFTGWPYYSKEEADKVKKVLLSNKVNYWTGTEGREFEREFALFTGSKYAVALSNGTVALELALAALNVSSNDEVLVTSKSFVASASSVVNVGATPIFCDILPNSQNIDPEDIEKKITDKTKAIICVHLAGWPCDMDEILRIAKKNKLFVIEDCAQAHGAIYKNKPVGSIGDVGCWSFCQDKIMTTGGEGGMITTNKKSIWSKVWSLKDHGKSLTAIDRYKEKKGFKWLHDSFGSNYRMTEFQASIGRLQLRKMKSWTKIRNSYQNIIWNLCRKYKFLDVPEFKCPTSTHAAYKCYVFINFKSLGSMWTRDKIIDTFNKNGIPCFEGSCSEIYMEKAFRNEGLSPKKPLKVAKEIGKKSLVFLVHPSMSKKEFLLKRDLIKKTLDKIDK